MTTFLRINALSAWVMLWSVVLVVLCSRLAQPVFAVFPQTWAVWIFQSGSVALGVWCYRATKVQAFKQNPQERDFMNTCVAAWCQGVIIPAFPFLVLILTLRASNYTFNDIEPFLALGGGLGWLQMLLNAQQQIVFTEKEMHQLRQQRLHRNSWRK